MLRWNRFACGALVLCLSVLGATWAEETTEVAEPTENPVVVMSTSKGTIEIELWPEKAPITVENFLAYVDKGYYDGTIFHRVIRGFMIQGGGFDVHMKKRPTASPIKNEADNGLKNVTGTIAMARTPVVDSATAQFFINTLDNVALNHRGPGAQFGYAVFGKVVSGMDAVKAIEAAPTSSRGRMQNVPIKSVTILSVKRK